MVIVAGQPLDISEDDCMLFSFMDMEPRRKVETALRQSEERFAKAFRLTLSRLWCVTPSRSLWLRSMMRLSAPPALQLRS